MNHYLKGAIVAVLAAAGVFVWYRSQEAKLPANQSPQSFQVINQMELNGVPDFDLERLDGTRFKLSDLKGKIIVVNFWASWCNPCVEEFPSIVKLAERMKGELVVVAVSTDEVKKDVEPFLRAFKVPKQGFEVVWDKDRKISELYGVGKIPESYIVGADFKLARKIVGIENWGSDEAVQFFQALKLGKAR